MSEVEEKGERKLEVSATALDVIRSSVGSRAVRVCSLIGPYRSGKSYLLNRLLQHDGPGGFDLGHSVKSKTKGIYAWAMETAPGEALLALDTEGLGDPEKSSCTSDDVKRFLLTLLLSSHLSLNILNVIDATLLDRLQFCAQLTSRIRSKRGADEKEDGTNFAQFFPHLMFVVRDFTKDLFDKADGFGGDADKYLLSLLKRVQSKSEDAQKHNAVREMIRDSFPSLACRVLIPPTLRPEVELLLLDSPDGEKYVRPEFKSALETVLREIASSPLKRVEQVVITGESFCLLVASYVSDINDPERVPSIPNAFDAISALQGKAALAKAERAYVDAMDKLQMPMEAEALVDAHRAALSAAHSSLDAAVAARQLKASKLELELLIEEQKDGETSGGHWFRYLSQNRSASRVQCQSCWDRLMSALDQQVASGAFKTPSEFQAACSALEAEYVHSSVGPAKNSVKTEQQGHIGDLLRQISIQLKLDDATKQALELKLDAHAKQARLEEMDGELQRVRNDSLLHAEEAKKRQAELLAKMAEEKKQHTEEMKKLEAEQTRKIEKASGEMREEMEDQLAEVKRQAAEDNKKREEAWKQRLEEEKKRAAEQQEEMKKHDAKVSSRKYLVPVTNTSTGQTAMVEMSLDEVRKLGLNQYQ